MCKKAYLINNIEEYGKLIAFCINKDVTVFRSYWDEREKGRRVYEINFNDKRLYYSDKRYYEDKGYLILNPVFEFNNFGDVVICN